ncbi:MAG: glycogen/starch synthase [Elusimicrobiota bacterium]|jgi:starch synthase
MMAKALLALFLAGLSLSAQAGANARISLPARPAAILPGILPSVKPSLGQTPSIGPLVPLAAAWPQPSLRLAAAPSAAMPQAAAPRAAVAPDQALAPVAMAPVASDLAAPSPDAAPSALKEAVDADWAARMGEASQPLNILLVASESVPFIKTGGLADVVDALSRGFVDQGHRVTLMLPKYLQLDAAQHGLQPVKKDILVPLGGRQEKAELWHTAYKGVDVYFVGNDSLYSKDGIYAPAQPGYNDTDDRFIFFSRAALEAAKSLGFKPDIIHVHDWHAAVIPALLKLVYAADPFFAATRSIVTIHNIAYQGFFPRETMFKAGFRAEDFTSDKLEYYGNFSLLKAGLVFADAITTVSPNYARQIRQNNEFGRGLEGLLEHRKDMLHGIINGIDPNMWNPGTDAALAARYGAAGALAGKAANKAAMQSRAGLPAAPAAPVFGVISRPDAQKGLDLIIEAIPYLVSRGAQLMMLVGSDPGGEELRARLQEAAERYPDNVAYSFKFDDALARGIYAASDFFLMPSRFEPCGLAQLVAQAYGSLPIVTRTGGLADTITDLDADAARGDGFFIREFSAEAIKAACARALALYRQAPALAQARRTAMAKDSSWGPSIDEYLGLFRSL